MCQPHNRTLIFDLGDVLFTWSANTETSVTPKTLKQILSSTIWFEYECGRLSEAACYDQVSTQFAIPAIEVAHAFSQARDSLQANNEMIGAIRGLKNTYGSSLSIYAMSNISKEDWIVLSSQNADWSIFDQSFTSAHAGMRKPDLAFYHHVLKETKTLAQDVIFVDDKFENVFSARSLGMTGVVFDNTASVTRILRNMCGDPVGRGKDYLGRNAKCMDSVAENGVTIRDNYAQLLVLEATQNDALIHIKRHERTWNYFIGESYTSKKCNCKNDELSSYIDAPVLTTSSYPDDLDTTSVALWNLQCDPAVVTSVMDEMLDYVNSDGIIQTYFDKNRPRTDPVVCANVLALFYRHGRGSQLRTTLDWVYSVLLHRACMEGTRYYSSADVCLFFFGRLSRSSDSELHNLLGPLLTERVRERIGAVGDSLELAMRLLTCHILGLTNEIDRQALLKLQQDDGGWDAGWLCKYGSTGVRLGNRGLTTALAVNAIEVSLEKR